MKHLMKTTFLILDKIPVHIQCELYIFYKSSEGKILPKQAIGLSKGSQLLQVYPMSIPPSPPLPSQCPILDTRQTKQLLLVEEVLSGSYTEKQFLHQAGNTAATLQHQKRRFHRGKREVNYLRNQERNKQSKCSGRGNFFYLKELQLEYLSAHLPLLLPFHTLRSALQRRADSTFQAMLEAIINDDDDN